ncbi:hypothetical protein SESBI_10262 [Sesbania bispinosa]|nr:hypothetical protein SESBI_10262 [Sesbania bispinosa]
MAGSFDLLKPFATDMVLIDVEGEVYTMINFGVIRSAGNYRASKHEYKLLFSGKTRVFPTQFELIPLNGLSLMTTDEVAKTNGESNYLIAASGEKELVTEGSVVIQNVNNTSIILWNEDIQEVLIVKFIQWIQLRLAVIGIDPNVAIGEFVVRSPVIPLADDFLKLYPRKTLKQLQLIEEEGTFIVLATIISVLREEQWWYGVCKCHRAVTPDEGKSCKETLAETKDVKSGEHPLNFIRLVRKSLLFKVEKGQSMQLVKKTHSRITIVIYQLLLTYTFTNIFLQLNFDPPFPTLADGEGGEDAYETSSDELDVLVENRVASESNGEASSSSGGHF